MDVGRTIFLLLALAGCATPLQPNHVLIYSRTDGFRHNSIPASIAAVSEIAESMGCSVIATEDPLAFTDEALANTAVVAFLNTTRDVLGPRQEAALRRFVEGGGGFLGAHAAADTEYDWPWYGEELLGAYFSGHPAVQEATVLVLEPLHPSAAHLPARWVRTDEWYDYDRLPGDDVLVVMELDPGSYSGWKMPGRHPIAWCRRVGLGRSYYTGGGHTISSWNDADFRQHVRGALAWLMETDLQGGPQ